MTTSATTTRLAPQFPATTAEPDPRTLAGEHAMLLLDVRRRVAPVLALLDARGWPAAELHTLVSHLRSRVLRQASDEEVRLFPNGPSAPIAELTADHVRLRALTEQLDRVAATPGPDPSLRALIEQLLTVLRRHLVEEQAVLAALPDTPGVVPAAGELAAADHGWLPADDRPVLLVLDGLPREQAVLLGVERLLRLRPGQRAELRAEDTETLMRVSRWMQGFDSSGYGIDRVDTRGSGPALLVSRRHSG